jgi:hypothetical protein
MPLVEGLGTRVTLSNFPCVPEKYPWSIEQFVHVAWSNGSSWQLRVLDSIQPGKTKSYTQKELPREFPDETTPFFFLFPERLPLTLDRLIVSDLMHTEPNWRANIEFHSSTTSVSYQGEYPGRMALIERGTFMSFGSLAQIKSGLKTKFILANLTVEPKSDPCKIKFTQMKSKKILLETTVYRNRCSVLDLSNLSCDDTDPFFAFSDELTGVPLYLTHDMEFSKMSLEHTHPPTEILVFGNREVFQKKMKSWWLRNIR